MILVIGGNLCLRLLMESLDHQRRKLSLEEGMEEGMEKLIRTLRRDKSKKKLTKN